MYPYRRGGGKKRGKGGGGPGPRHLRDGGGGNSGRRVPGSAAEMLSLLQPTTKALAQMLAGNVRASGQLVHARNVLSQAQRLVEERAVDRLPPARREEFLEQLARLKLTLADADEAGLLQEAEPAAEPRPAAAALTADQLRDVARRLAMSEAPAPAPAGPPTPPAFGPGDDDADEPDGGAGEDVAGPAAPAGVPDQHRRGERLRLRIASGPDAAAPVRVRDRLRLKPLKPAAGSSRD